MIFSVDTETTGLYSFNGDRPFCITTCDMDGVLKYTAIGEDDLIPIDLLLMDSGNEAVGHNIKFDMHMLRTVGMEFNCKVHDTMVAAFIHNTDEETFKLKHLAKKYLGVENEQEVQLKVYLQKHGIRDYSQVPREIMVAYALEDARITLELFKFFRKKGITSDPIYLSEMELVKCVVAMERRGLLIDPNFCRLESDKCKARMAEITDIIKKDHKGINPRSSDQLAEYLFHDCGLRCDAVTEKGNPSFDEYNLSKYNHPIVPLILELRELGKIQETYLEGLLTRKDKDNVVHANFLQTGARTGRFSCTEPNLQNIPRSAIVDVRRAFICRPDYINYHFDYSQIELRILAHYSQEPLMVDEYNKTDNDLHAVTAKAVFGEVTKEKRSLAKNINFGIIYGMGPKKFCEMVNREYPQFNMTYSQAREFINKYYTTYPAVRQFTWRVPQKIMDVGYVKDIFGRKYTCPSGESYKGVNYLIQGCAAGIIKKAMIDISTRLQGTKSNLISCIHDELVIEIHKDEEAILVPEIHRLMEDRTTFRVPILVNIEKTATDWSQKA